MLVHILIYLCFVSVSFGQISVKGVDGGVDFVTDQRKDCHGVYDNRLAREKGTYCVDGSEIVCLPCCIPTEFGEGVDDFNSSEPKDVSMTRCKKTPETVIQRDTDMRLSPTETVQLDHDTRNITIIGCVLATVAVNYVCYIVLVARRRKNKPAIRDTPCEEETASRSSTLASSPSSAPSSVDLDQSIQTNLHVESDKNGYGCSRSNMTECKAPHGQGFLEPSSETEQPANNVPENSENVSNQQLLDEIQERKERMNCKVCLNARMCVVFLPCNHMLACGNCSVLMDRCAVCRTLIKGTFVVHTQF